MSRPLTALTAGLLFWLSLASAPARAESLVIEGRAAQALQCSAMLFMTANVMYEAGYVPAWVQADAQRIALLILEQVPGTEEQRIQAMTQRFQKIVASKTPEELVGEYEASERWCRKEFLPG